MAEYSRRWQSPTEIFRQTISEAMISAAERFVDRNIAISAPALAVNVKQKLREQNLICDQKASERLTVLAEQELLPTTENHYLYDTINKIRNERMEASLRSLNPDKDGNVSKTAVLAMLKSTVGNDSNESQEVQDMIDVLSAYWKLAVKRYIDEVCMIVTDVYTGSKRVENMESQLVDIFLDCDDSELEEFFKETPQRERRRRELNVTHKTMLMAKMRMSKYSSLYS